MSVESETVACLRDVMGWSAGEGITDVSAPLRSSVDSLRLVQLVTRLEEHFAIQFFEGDLDDACWDTVHSIAQLIERKRSGEK
jgi:acyl carrier protein